MAEQPWQAPRLLLVSPGDRAPARTLELCAAVLAGGVDALLLREPQLAPAERALLAEQLRQITREHGARLFVQREVLLALRVDADGVHTGTRGPSVASLREQAPALKVSRSAHWPLEPDDLGADLLLLSPFGETPRSWPRPLLKAEQVEAVLARPGCPPVLALGGLTASAVPALHERLAGVAVLRALAEAADPRRAAAELRAALEQRWPQPARLA
ncbi:MAG: thiamine phosphate synthase [Planctomycetota bacterium]